MPNEETTKIILEFPASSLSIELGTTITFDNISGFLGSDRVTVDGDTLTEKLSAMDSEIDEKADSDDVYDKTYIDNAFTGVNSSLANKMDKANPTGTGSFSLNRKAGSTVGYNSVAIGNNNEASGNYSCAEGYSTKALGHMSHAEGYKTTAKSNTQHVFGRLNVPDFINEFVEIVGNGDTTFNLEHNARTLDWSGNETLAGDLTYNGNKSITSEVQRLDDKIDALPEPMVFKGTLGVGGTIQTLPVASTSNEGYTYKVITAGTYAGTTAKVGDVFTSDGSTWVLIPSGDEDNDTWRAIKVNGVEKLGNAISSGSVDFVDTDNVKFEFDANGNKVKATLSGIDTSAQVDEKVAGIIDDTEASESKAYSSSKVAELLGNKADVDGIYDNMTVGNAKQLKSNVGEVDKVPYLFRPSGGYIDIGESETDSLVGGTVAFNQLVQNGNFADDSVWSKTNATLSASGNIATITLTAENGYVRNIIPMISGHKYLCMLDIKGVSGIIYVFNVEFANYVGTGNWVTLSNIYNATSTGNHYLQLRSQETSDFQPFNVRNVRYFDLTQMFGSTIADYIYSLEQGTAGAGVAWFRNLFPKSYYAYNAGELMSVKASKHITTGFNQWDEEWELGSYNATGQPTSSQSIIRTKNYIPCVSNTTYYGKVPANTAMVVYFYDADKNYISDVTKTNRTFTTPANACFMRFRMSTQYGTTYNHDICINLSWDGERNGEYEPYVKHEYDYSGEREVTRYFGYRDYESGDESLTDAITDGTHTVYKLATPYTETVSNPELRGIPKLDANNKLYYYGDTCSDLPNPQIVDDFGTEEYVDNREVAIPVGHDTFYQANLRAKLEMSPDSPSGDGDYIVRQTNGQNEYVAFVKELPTLPSTDGTYTLKCTVSGSTKTLSWVADT